MEIILFILYLVLFVWMLNRIPFIRNSGLSTYWITGLFLLKVAAGITYGFYYSLVPDFKNQADTWSFFYASLSQTRLLKENPLDFFIEIFDNAEGSSYRRFFSTTYSFWADIKHLLMVKLVAVFNLFSGKVYYTNVVLYSFITFFGPVALFKVMDDVFPGRRKILTVAIFLSPSFLFWCSGIHKEGLIFLLFAYSCYIFYFGIKHKKKPVYYILVASLCIGLIFPIRNYISLAMLPFFISWWIAEKWFYRKWIPFVITGIIGTMLFFGTRLVVPVVDAPTAVIMRKNEFTKLGGQSILPQRKLESSFISFLKNAPQALNHSLVRPYISEIYSPFYFLCAIEILLIWILVFIWYFRYRENLFDHSVVLAVFMISFVVLLLIGYIVPQLGAIVRYRSIFIPFIIAPIVATIRWKNTY
jgi:hypothetical protein